MSQYLEGQTHQLAEALQKHGFSAADVTALGQNSNGVLNHLKMILLGLAAVVRFCLKLELDKVFNPAEFVGNGWSVWRGPADGNGLEGDEDCVSEPDAIDFEQIIIETHLQENENSIYGEEKMKRARFGENRQLGSRAFLALWNDWQKCKAAGKPEESILEKLRLAGKIDNSIYFFGLALRGPHGRRYVLYLYFFGRGWFWSSRWLGNHWRAVHPSVSLAQVSISPLDSDTLSLSF